MTYIKDVPAYVCFACSNTQYIGSMPSSPPSSTSTSSTLGGLLSSDDLTDRRTRPNTSGRKFHSMKDPRATSGYAKPNQSEVDKEMQDYIESHSDFHLISYKEHTEQSLSVIDRKELRDRDRK